VVAVATTRKVDRMERVQALRDAMHPDRDAGLRDLARRYLDGDITLDELIAYAVTRRILRGDYGWLKSLVENEAGAGWNEGDVHGSYTPDRPEPESERPADRVFPAQPGMPAEPFVQPSTGTETKVRVTP
jgi:hypothetical protein